MVEYQHDAVGGVLIFIPYYSRVLLYSFNTGFITRFPTSNVIIYLIYVLN